jgi:energy-coupling factor transporter ATP-binding protein EcfA2
MSRRVPDVVVLIVGALPVLPEPGPRAEGGAWLHLLASSIEHPGQALAGWLLGGLLARTSLARGRSALALGGAAAAALALAPAGLLAAVPLLSSAGSLAAILGALVALAPGRDPLAGQLAAGEPRTRDFALLGASARALGAALVKIGARGACALRGYDALVGAVQAIERIAMALFGATRGAGANRSRSELLLGRELCSGRRVRIPIAHTLVIGATGAGKTVTLRSLVGAGARTHGVIALDGKGDPDLAEALARAAAREGRELYHWSPWLQTTYNPFGHGSETEIVDKALAAESYGDSYYLRIGQRFLGFAVRALHAAGREVTIGALAHFANPSALEQLAPEMEARRPGSWAALAGSLPALSSREREALAGTQHRLATLAESDIGALLEPAEGRARIDLPAAARNGEVVYFNLNADARPELARMLGAAIIIDLLSVAAQLQRERAPASSILLFDDIQAFASDAALGALASLFARGRSAGLTLFLATQSLADLELGKGRRAAGAILDNRTNLIVHRLPGYESAQRAARELGERIRPIYHEQLEADIAGWRPCGRATRSETAAENVPARELMELATGVAVVQSGGRRVLVTAIQGA